MGHGSVSRGRSIAGSSNYEPSYRTSSSRSTAQHSSITSRDTNASTLRGSTITADTSLSIMMRAASMTSPKHHQTVASKNPKASNVVRASTVTSATSMSKLIRSASTASTDCDRTSASKGSSLRPSTVTSRTSRASTLRASTNSSATSTSNFIHSNATASTIRLETLNPASTSTTSLLRSASRFLWGRPPPGHSTLQPSQIASLTQILSFPADTPMHASIIGALGTPLSRDQFSPAPTSFCNAHFWFQKRYIDELTEVVAHEIGPQLDRLRTAPDYLISKKSKRLLAHLEPYRDVFTAGITDTSSSISSSTSSMSLNPVCQACTLSSFFQNPDAVHALTTCVKGRKHRNRPYPGSMAWLEPCPGKKGLDWEAKWKHEGKCIARDRIHVQRWRRANRANEPGVGEQTAQVVAGHGPGEGCDFCDNLRMEQGDEADLDAEIAEEEGDEEGAGDDLDAGSEDESIAVAAADDADSVTLRGSPSSSDSETLRAIEEESIIKAYLHPSSSSTSRRSNSVYHHQAHECESWQEQQQGIRRKKQSMMTQVARMGEKEGEERKRRASDWARSYEGLVGRGPGNGTTLMFEQFSEVGGG